MSKIWKPVVRVAAPVLGGIFGGPLGAAAGGALSSAATGGSGKDIALSGLLGGAGGLAAGALGSAASAGSGLGSKLLGTVAGAPLSGGVGPAAGSGLIGGLTRAVPSIGSGLMSAGNALSGATGSLSSMLGTSAGTPLAGGVGPTAGTGILGGVTEAASKVPGLSSIGSALTQNAKSTGGSGMSAPLSSIFGGILQRRSADKQKDEILNQLGNIRSEYEPYRETGLAANERLSGLLSEGSDFGAPTESFSMDAFEADPGYEFRKQQQEEALNRKLAASGNYFSGDALKAAQQYGGGLAAQEYGDAFSRYGQEADRKRAEESQLYNMLYGQQTAGRNVAGSIADTMREEALAKAATQAARDNSLSQMIGSIF
jgi:hypothetical protein